LRFGMTVKRIRTSRDILEEAGSRSGQRPAVLLKV
jgi:hypothetical protein